jgi:hypothetical protein
MGAPGFDDAPLWTTMKASLPKKITLVYPYYDNALFLHHQLEGWRALPDHIRDWLRIIIVDDGSPNIQARSVVGSSQWPFDVSVYRIEVDIRWNWLAARNIGMNHAEEGWCVLTDMDHVIPQDTFDRLLYRWYNENIIYRFSRREHTGQLIHPHPNSMFMTKSMFWKIGGYDEALSGHYGTDGDWRRRCAATASVRTLPHELIRHEYQQDSSTTSYLRKQPEDAGKKAIIAKRGPSWKPRTLSFPYHKVEL